MNNMPSLMKQMQCRQVVQTRTAQPQTRQPRAAQTRTESLLMPIKTEYRQPVKTKYRQPGKWVAVPGLRRIGVLFFICMVFFVLICASGGLIEGWLRPALAADAVENISVQAGSGRSESGSVKIGAEPAEAGPAGINSAGAPASGAEPAEVGPACVNLAGADLTGTGLSDRGFPNVPAATDDPALVVAARTAPLEVLIGQMVMLGFRGTQFESDSVLARDIEQGHLGGVVLFDHEVRHPGMLRNIESPVQVRTLISDIQARAGIPLFVAVDQEGGRVRRLKPERGFQDMPGAAELGSGPPLQTLILAHRVGEQLHDLGFNVNFAPVADVARVADSPSVALLGRAFSADPMQVTEHDRAFLQGLAEAKVWGCLKHFPGHGSARKDTHDGIADISKTWDPVELEPYRVLIREGVVPMVMVGHVYHSQLDFCFPASLSWLIVTGMLRQTLGFDGVIISDDLHMKAIWDRFSLEDIVRLSLQAGLDILLFGNNLEYDPDLLPKVSDIIRDLVASGTVPRARLEASYIRIMRLKTKLVVMHR